MFSFIRVAVVMMFLRSNKTLRHQVFLGTLVGVSSPLHAGHMQQRIAKKMAVLVSFLLQW